MIGMNMTILIDRVTRIGSVWLGGSIISLADL